MPPVQAVTKPESSHVTAGPKHNLKMEPPPQLKKEAEGGLARLKLAPHPPSSRPQAKSLEASLKRDKSNLFTSFAKTKPKQTKSASETSTPVVEESVSTATGNPAAIILTIRF
jgi:DNA polymerase delta subunit 3